MKKAAGRPDEPARPILRLRFPPPAPAPPPWPELIERIDRLERRR